MAAKKAPENALVVRTFSYPTTAEGTGPGSIGTRPLAGVDITLKKGTDPNSLTPVRGPVRSGPNGEVRFENVDEGTEYRIFVERPAGFALQNHLFIDDQPPVTFDKFNKDKEATSKKIELKEGGEKVVEIGILPIAGKVTGQVVVKTPDGAPITTSPKIRVEARNGGLLIDSTEVEPATDPEYTLEIDRPGLIEIIAQPSIELDGRIYRPEHTSQFVLVQPGATVEVNIKYDPAGAELIIGAQLVEELDGQEQRRPLDEVTFRLFEPGDDQPLRELVTKPNTVSAFSELAPGTYRIEAVPPATGNGQRLQLTHPSTPFSIVVGDGQRIDLTNEFQFEPVRGSVLGTVVVARDNEPVPGVSVVLSSLQQPQVVRPAVTDQDGEYEIGGLPPGSYRVALQQTVVTALGARWEQEGEGDRGRTVEVRPRATTLVPEFRLVEEEHLITGQVLEPGGTGAPFVAVQIFKDIAAATPEDTVLTDQDGFYRYRAETPGTYFLRVLEQDGFAAQLTPVTVNSSATAPPLFTSTRSLGGGGGGGPTGTGGGSPAPPPEPNDFPFLTEEVDLAGRGGAGTPSAGGIGAVGQTVERTLREVLGWRPRPSDPKGFQAALLQAFTVEQVAGHTEVRWNPRSYAVEIQADLGTITGAQASLYTRAKGALDQIRPLLDGLEPLRVDFDPENVDAIRAIVRSHVDELVTELGVEGGPRVQRVDQLFAFLLGETAFEDLGVLRDPDKVGGSLGILRDRLGLQRHRINTIEEEQGFTNFLVLVDHVVSLAESWDAQREFFVRGSTLVEPFLGTQLVLVSRDLEVVAESVHEVEFAMDSVFLGPSERQTLELRFPPGSASGTLQRRSLAAPGGSPPMFVSELLTWVERFATEEGRRLIDDGGKQGVVAFRPTILLLEALVRDARVAPAGAQDPRRMPDAYRRPRVQRALAELASQLAATAARVEQIRAPNGPVVPPPLPPINPPPRPPPPRPPRPPRPPLGRPEAGSNGVGDDGSGVDIE
jgi:hypothetical protein